VVNERDGGINLGPALLGIALALGLIISTAIAMRTVEKVKITNRTITVKGYAEKDIVSDWATWGGSFKVKTTALVEGYAELEADLQKVIAYLKAQGVSEELIVVSSISTTTQYKLDEEGRRTNEIEAEYLYTKLDELKIEMLGKATANARQRAEQLATNSGGRVGPLRSANQGVFQITPKYSTEISNYGTYSTTTIEKKIKAVVTIEYSIR
jgi:hypothetical protein